MGSKAMDDAEMLRALDGLFAYDLGAVDSGFRDEALRTRLFSELHAHSGQADRVLRSWLRSLLDPPYGPEDVASAVRWLDDNGYSL